MTQLLVFLAFVLALVALQRARSADRRVAEVMERLRRLEAQLAERSALPAEGATPVAAQAAATRPPSPAGVPVPPPVWPEDVQAAPLDLRPAAPAPPARPRGPSIWGPEFSRARISVIGGALVLFGLAFTLRALGLPAWTLLLAVFAFGGLLYAVARHTPQPVSGALRGLGYGVAALGVGSLAQRLPDDWGPGAVMLGLLGLSAALAWDGQRRRQPLLGALAVGGSALSVWLLADDLGRVSILAAGAVMGLAGLAVAGARVALAAAPELDAPELDASELDVPGLAGRRAGQLPSAEDWRVALALTLGAAGVVPLGWLVASANHQSAWWNANPDDTSGLLTRALLLDGAAAPGQPAGLLVWAAFGVLALAPTLALLRGPALPDRSRTDTRLRLAGVWAGLAPYLPVMLAVGVGLNGEGRSVAGALPVLGLLLALLAAAAWAWRLVGPPGRVSEEGGETGAPESGLPGALAGALTAATTGVLGAALVALLGLRSQPSALAGVALALLLLGLHGRSRVWLRLGALGLALVAAWSVLVGLGGPSGSLVLGLLPPLIGLAGALRLAADRWATMPAAAPPAAPEPGSPAAPSGAPRRAASWLATASSLILVLAVGDRLWPMLAVTVTLAVALWLSQAPSLGRRRITGSALAGTLRAAALPGLALGGLWLLAMFEDGPHPLAALLGALLAGGGLLWYARHRLTEGLALALLTGALALGLGGEELESSVPAAAAVVALLSALVPRALPPVRVDMLLGLGLLGGWLGTLAGTAGRPGLNLWLEAGTLLVLAVWLLTRTPAGQAWLRAAFPPSAHGLEALPPVPANRFALWLAALVAPPILGLSLFSPTAGGSWYSLASLAMLLVGLQTCVQAFREAHSPDARARWTAGVVVMIAAGLKGATLDALVYRTPGVAAGLAVLVSGLSLLLLAVLAPRPPAAPTTAAEASGPAEPASLG
ncbi:hypothetical protein [Deinococcus koreensis]|uniref:hypothetical protein n=1 Tax=Deinococcus koreensis TaxID=2054903 RepID=UPI0013FD5C06|nr:hypothetical protein [Deinococcus koreensis]